MSGRVCVCVCGISVYSVWVCALAGECGGREKEREGGRGGGLETAGRKGESEMATTPPPPPSLPLARALSHTHSRARALLLSLSLAHTKTCHVLQLTKSEVRVLERDANSPRECSWW